MIKNKISHEGNLCTVDDLLDVCGLNKFEKQNSSTVITGISIEDIINFLELPEEYDELFAVWMEHGQPTSEEIDSWNIFLSSVQLRGWQKKNKS